MAADRQLLARLVVALPATPEGASPSWPVPRRRAARGGVAPCGIPEQGDD